MYFTSSVPYLPSSSSPLILSFTSLFHLLTFSFHTSLLPLILRPHPSRIHVVFGHTIAGMEYVTAVENQKVDVNHRPYADVRIQNCGELVLMRSKDFLIVKCNFL